MKILRILLYVLLAAVALLFGAGLFAKKDLRVERAAVINAPMQLVYEQVLKFENSRKWSPWEALDPNIKTKVEGQDGAVGAVYSWEGNDKVGKGSQKLISVEPNLIKHELHFIEPFESRATTFFSLHDADGGGTKVVWGMDTKLPYPWNGFAMFTDMDKALGKDFETGLKNLQRRCEELADPTKYRGFTVSESDFAQMRFVGYRDTVPFGEIGSFFSASAEKAAKSLAAQKIEPTGPPCGLFYFYDEKAGQTDMAAVLPVSSAADPKAGAANFSVGPGRAVSIDYFGPYEKTGEAHYAIDDYMTEKGLEMIAPCVELYSQTDGLEKDTAKWHTRILYFVKVKPIEK